MVHNLCLNSIWFKSYDFLNLPFNLQKVVHIIKLYTIKIVNLLEKTEIIKSQEECKEIPKKCKIENNLAFRIKNIFRKVFMHKNLRVKLIEKFPLHFGHIRVKKINVNFNMFLLA